MVYITEIDTHTRFGFAVLIKADTNEQCTLFKMGAAIIDVHEIHHLIVGNIYIHITIIIDVSQYHTQPFAAIISYSRFVCPI